MAGARSARRPDDDRARPRGPPRLQEIRRTKPHPTPEPRPRRPPDEFAAAGEPAAEEQGVTVGARGAAHRVTEDDLEDLHGASVRVRARPLRARIMDQAAQALPKIEVRRPAGQFPFPPRLQRDVREAIACLSTYFRTETHISGSHGYGRRWTTSRRAGTQGAMDDGAPPNAPFRKGRRRAARVHFGAALPRSDFRSRGAAMEPKCKHLESIPSVAARRRRRRADLPWSSFPSS